MLTVDSITKTADELILARKEQAKIKKEFIEARKEEQAEINKAQEEQEKSEIEIARLTKKIKSFWTLGKNKCRARLQEETIKLEEQKKKLEKLIEIREKGEGKCGNLIKRQKEPNKKIENSIKIKKEQTKKILRRVVDTLTDDLPKTLGTDENKEKLFEILENFHEWLANAEAGHVVPEMATTVTHIATAAIYLDRIIKKFSTKSTGKSSDFSLGKRECLRDLIVHYLVALEITYGMLVDRPWPHVVLEIAVWRAIQLTNDLPEELSGKLTAREVFFKGEEYDAHSYPDVFHDSIIAKLFEGEATVIAFVEQKDLVKFLESIPTESEEEEKKEEETVKNSSSSSIPSAGTSVGGVIGMVGTFAPSKTNGVVGQPQDGGDRKEIFSLTSPKVT